MKSFFKTMLYLISASVMIFVMSACGTKTTGPAPEVAIDLGSSSLYTQEELNTAILLIKDKFATFAGCELHSIRYAGDNANNEENLEWLNSLREVRSNIPPVCNLAWLFTGVKLQRLFRRHKKVISILMAISLVYCAVSLVL